MNNTKKTERIYSLLWGKVKAEEPDKWHFNNMQEAVIEPIVRGQKGIDIGSGCGYDTFIMAKNNPLVKIISMEISDGAYKAREFTKGLENVLVIKGSVLSLPIADSTLDFAYSFGVLHHIPQPEKGIREIARVIKKNSPAYLYVYEDHSENRFKYMALKLIKAIRTVTTKMPAKVLYILTFLASPFVVIIFSLPARVLKKFSFTRDFSKKVPFNFGTHLFSVAGDLYDRFGAPIEYRFSRQGIFDLLKRNGFANISICRMKATAGWVVRGVKNND